MDLLDIIYSGGRSLTPNELYYFELGLLLGGLIVAIFGLIITRDRKIKN